jgi:hypothetical protein
MTETASKAPTGFLAALRVRSFRRIAAGLCVLGASACADEVASVGQTEQAVIYGQDDRRELFELAPADALRPLARSVAAVIPRSALSPGPDGQLVLIGKPLTETFSLCPDQRDATELGAAECTAFLIDDALLASAGHCFKNALDCQNYVFVFDYVRVAQGAPVALAAENIYECRGTQVRVDLVRPGAPKQDYAIVELTRRVLDRQPLALRSDLPSLAEPLSVISASSGLPLKFDRGARVLDVRVDAGDFLRLDSDTGHGASGAPVLDAQGRVVGIAVRGRTDHVLDEARGCFVENVLPPSELVAPGEPVKLPGGGELYSEEASLLAPALAALCQTPYPSLRFCGRAAVCGDQSCSGDETFELCPGDCAEAPPSRPAAVAAPAAVQGKNADSAYLDAGLSVRARQDGGCALAARDGSGRAWWVALALALYVVLSVGARTFKKALAGSLSER